MNGRFRCLLLALAAAQTVAGAEGLSLTEMTAARAVYVAKCAKCHRFYEPSNYSETDWQRWMQRMNKKSKLKPEQATLLNRYLDLYRAGKLAGKPEAKPGGPRGQEVQ